MNTISTLIFDLGGVILNLKTEKEWVEEDLLPNFYPEQLQVLQEQLLFQQIETGKISRQDFIRQLKTIAIDSTISEGDIIRHWNGILKEIPLHRVELLHRLRKKYRLVLLSNTNEIHTEKFVNDIIQTFGEDILQAIFDTVYYSQNIGLRKPNKEIYKFVMQDQGLQSSEILFLDDKAENLIEPRHLGWQTVHVSFNKLSSIDLQHLL